MADAFICDSARTPIGRFGGALSRVRTDDLAAYPIAALMARNPSLDPIAIDEVIYGCANQSGEDNRNIARMAALLAGLPESVPGMTLNRLCGSGMDAVGTVARAIRSGEIDLAIAGGVESMSRAPFVMPKAGAAFSRQTELYDTTIGWRFINKKMHTLYGTDSMPETAENVADDFNINREDQDLFSLRSQQKAGEAMDSGRLTEEIIAIPVAGRKGETTLVEKDEHPRPDTSLSALQGLPTPFRDGGTVTAGNAAGINDGAAGMLIASESAIKQHDLKAVARIVSMATAGVSPRIMGIGPVPASKKALGLAGIDISDVGIIELNEAFASQGLAVLRELDVSDDDDRVNPNGGAIALGHPLGMSGSRLIMTAARQFNHDDARYALCTMCIGVGQGIAVVLERI